MDNKRVFIPILYDSYVGDDNLKEVCAGLEEEGVPYLPKQTDTVTEASIPTPLEVKIVVKRDVLKIYHAKIPSGDPYIIEKSGNERLIGKNAARIVKGLPLVVEK
jgi:hypothetical protein